MIPYSRQQITLGDRISVFRALGKPLITQGPSVEAFEDSISKLVGAQYVVATNSATSALHLACLALDLGPGDLLWTSTVTFVASANCALYCGASVDLVDIDSQTFNISIPALRLKLQEARRSGELPKILVVVHLAGEPAELDEIKELANEYGFKILEDASHALGSRYQDSPIGSCEFSDVTVFSFHAVKNITTGEGGSVCTNSPAIAERVKILRSHGIIRDSTRFRIDKSSQTPWHYEQQFLGYNYRITDFQAALGESQLGRLGRVIRHRQKIFQWYSDALGGSKHINLQKVKSKEDCAFHLVIARVPSGCRQEITEELLQHGFATNLHYFPIHSQPFHSITGSNFPNAEDYAVTAISLPCHAGVTKGMVRKVSRIILDVIERHM